MAIFGKTEDSDLDIYKKGDYYLHHTTDEHPRDEMFPTHAHRYCELFYCIAGKGLYTVERKVRTYSSALPDVGI